MAGIPHVLCISVSTPGDYVWLGRRLRSSIESLLWADQPTSMRLGDPAFSRAFARARRASVLLRALREGTLQSGDAIEVSSVSAHRVTSPT